MSGKLEEYVVKDREEVVDYKGRRVGAGKGALIEVEEEQKEEGE